MLNCRSIFFIILGLFIITACATSKQQSTKASREAHFTKVSFSELKQWEYDNQYEALQAFKKSCKIILNKDSSKPISKLTKLGGTIADWQPICKELMASNIIDSKQARAFFEKWFVPYKITDNHGNTVGKFTGYYEIELHGSRVKTDEFRHPVYQCPVDIKHHKGKSHFTHARINNGHLKGKGLEIAYVNNQARLFFMHVQGSGVIRLPTGEEMKVGYAEENGHPYKSIVNELRQHCKEPVKSATDMMDWLHRHPDKGRKIMEANPSYVFFRKIQGDGPVGGQGVALTSERSIAIDYKLYPYSTPVWVQTTTPKMSYFPSVDYNRLFIAQDTGGAIKGAVRADIFYGRGQMSEKLAGLMNNAGTYYMLFPKKVSIPKSYKS